MVPLILVSCESSISGDLKENQPPTTNLTVEKIDRGNDFRLSSQINISWWGNDPDGYVIGYEYAINDTSEGAWEFTSRSDSTFILPITEGQQTDEVLFKVRAVDNDSLRDPVGARLVYPIENTGPKVLINENEVPPDTLFSMASFGWEISDPDGLLNIASTEIAINDTVNGWVSVPLPEEEDEGELYISLEVDNSSAGAKEADMFIGRSFTSTSITVPGIEVGTTNTFYVRVTDKAGAVSGIDTVSWFVKQKTSNVLLINDNGLSNSFQIQAFHENMLGAHGITPDIWVTNDLNNAQNNLFPSSLDDFVLLLRRTLNKWDHIYWISNNVNGRIGDAIDFTTTFFEQDGTMFVSIPMTQSVGPNEEIFNFLPVDSTGVLTGLQAGFVVQNNSYVTPFNNVSNDSVRVQSSSPIGMFGFYPIKPTSGGTLLYTADYKTRTQTGQTVEYDGFEGAGVQSPEGNLIYFSLDMQSLNGDGNIADLIEFFCVERLGFSE